MFTVCATECVESACGDSLNTRSVHTGNNDDNDNDDNDDVGGG